MESDSVSLFLRSQDFENYLDEMVAKRRSQLEVDAPTKCALVFFKSSCMLSSIGKGLKGAGSAIYGVMTSVGQKKSRMKAHSDHRPPKYNTWAGLKKNHSKRPSHEEELMRLSSDAPTSSKSSKSSPAHTINHSPILSGKSDEKKVEEATGRHSDPIKKRALPVQQSITATTFKQNGNVKAHHRAYRKRGGKRSPGHTGQLKQRLRSIESSGDSDLPEIAADS